MQTRIYILSRLEEIRESGFLSLFSFLMLGVLSRLLSMIPAVGCILVLAKLIDGTFGPGALALLFISALSLILSARIPRSVPL